MSPQELLILESLDSLLQSDDARAGIEPIVERVERKLSRDDGAAMAWEPIPLSIYGGSLPAPIRSSWVFILRAGAATGAERHPNSQQRMMSYRGTGDLQTGGEGRWQSTRLISEASAALEQRWISVPPNVWHQAVVPDQDWVVVSFHTVSAEELIEERPDTGDPGRTNRRRYLGQRGENPTYSFSEGTAHVHVEEMTATDWEDVCAIYLEGIASGQATFEVEAPSWEQWDAAHHPFGRLVARSNRRVVGWAALSPVSRRPCYAGVAEVSVYVATEHRSRGIGGQLLRAVIAESERHGIWTLQGATFPANEASLRLQRACGFREIGRRKRIAQLHGIWRDTVLTEWWSTVIGGDGSGE
jgi:L-amino acid N-acyltransferase YncA